MSATELKLPEAGIEYYEGRTDGWNWDDEERWWEKWIVWDNGFDGLMQPVCRRFWRWNGSNEILRRDYDIHMSPQQLTALANGITLQELETIAKESTHEPTN